MLIVCVHKYIVCCSTDASSSMHGDPPPAPVQGHPTAPNSLLVPYNCPSALSVRRTTGRHTCTVPSGLVTTMGGASLHHIYTHNKWRIMINNILLMDHTACLPCCVHAKCQVSSLSLVIHCGLGFGIIWYFVIGTWSTGPVIDCRNWHGCCVPSNNRLLRVEVCR